MIRECERDEVFLIFLIKYQISSWHVPNLYYSSSVRRIKQHYPIYLIHITHDRFQSNNNNNNNNNAYYGVWLLPETWSDCLSRPSSQFITEYFIEDLTLILSRSPCASSGSFQDISLYFQTSLVFGPTNWSSRFCIETENLWRQGTHPASLKTY